MPRGPAGGMYDAKFEPHITHFTFQKILPKGKIFGNVQNRSIIEKKGVLKNCIFWAICEEVFAKSALHQVEKWYQIVKSNAFWMILLDLEQNLTQSQIFR